MAFKEDLGRLDGAGLQLSASPTKIGREAAVVAQNTEFWPHRTISKRPGYTRWRNTQEVHPVTGVLGWEGNFLIMAGDLDEL